MFRRMLAFVVALPLLAGPSVSRAADPVPAVDPVATTREGTTDPIVAVALVLKDEYGIEPAARIVGVSGGEAVFVEGSAVQRRRGHVKFNDLTITRRVDPADDRWAAWFEAASKPNGGKLARRSATLAYLDAQGVSVRTVELIDALPTHWSQSLVLQTGPFVYSTETLTLEVEHYTLVALGDCRGCDCMAAAFAEPIDSAPHWTRLTFEGTSGNPSMASGGPALLIAESGGATTGGELLAHTARLLEGTDSPVVAAGRAQTPGTDVYLWDLVIESYRIPQFDAERPSGARERLTIRVGRVDVK